MKRKKISETNLVEYKKNINVNEKRRDTPAIGKLWISVGNTNILAAIDGGADVSMVNPITVNKLGWEPEMVVGYYIDGISGPLNIREKVRNVKIKIGSSIIKMDFDITERCPYPILLGRDWICRVKAVIDYDLGTLVLKDNIGEIFRIYELGNIIRRDRFEKGFKVIESDANNSPYEEYDENTEEEELYSDEYEDYDEQEVLMLEYSKVVCLENNEDWRKYMTDVEYIGFLLEYDEDTKKLKLNQFANTEKKFKNNNMITEIENTNQKAVYISEAEIQTLKIGDGLDSNEKEELKSMIREYPKLFGENLEDMRRIKLDPLKIELTDNTPFKLPPYRVPLHQLDTLKKELSELRRMGIIVENKGPYSSPILMVKKKDKSWRLVVDYRRLNKITKKDSGDIPIIQDLLDRTTGSSIFSSMDCRSGFWQWEMNEESIEKTGFSTPFGSFCYVVCPMGFTNAAQGFHRIITKIFEDMVTINMEIIIDDIVIHSKNSIEHLQHLKKTFKLAERANVVFRPSKCQFGMQRIRIWSWVVDKDGISADPKNVEKIKNAKEPRNVKEVRSFIGLMQYYRRLIPNFSAVAAPLTDLMKGEGKNSVKLGESEIKSFNELKDLLTISSSVIHPDPKKMFIVKSDAGPYAVGGILLQNRNNEEHPVAFTSYKLNKHQQNYGQTKKELLAVVLVVRNWKHYLLGTHIPFQIITDCIAVRDMMNKKNLSGIFARWIMELQEYNFEIVYKKGKFHTDADSMSRYPGYLGDEIIDEECEDLLVEVQNRDENDKLDISDIFFSEATEFNLKHIKNYLNTCEIPNNTSHRKLRRQAEKYFLQRGTLYRKHKDGVGRRVIMDEDHALQVLKELHNSICGGHYGIEGTVKKIAIRYYWPGMGSDTKEYIKNCLPCQLRNRKRYEELLPRMIMPRLFEKWGGDAIGPLPKSGGMLYIILWTDYFSKWTVGRAVKDITCKTVAKSLLEDVIWQHGFPREIITDRGSGFVGSVGRGITRRLKIKKRRTTSYNPKCNGQAERTNGTVIESISKLAIEFETKWIEVYKWAIWAYNITKRRPTKETPFYVKYGTHPVLPIDLEIPSEEGNK